MKNIILLLTISGLVVASIWMYKSNFDFEPTLAVLGLAVAILSYFIYDNYIKKPEESIPNEGISATINQNPVTTIAPIFNINHNEQPVSFPNNNQEGFHQMKKDEIIESMKAKTKILFIDDDPGFNIVKILKESGWNETSTIKDLKSIDMPIVKNANVLFIDNHGVGKLLNCKYEGLDLVKMIKEKYPEKVVVIYSGDSQGNLFHEAIGLANYRLIKNALPYEFQKIIENTSLDIYNKKNKQQ